MIKKKYRSFNESYLNGNKVLSNFKNENEYYEIESSLNDSLKVYFINILFLNNDNNLGKDFLVDFYNEIRNCFNHLKVTYTCSSFKIMNKNNILKNLNNLTFDYFKKYPKKARVINSIFIQIKKSLKHENLEQEMEETSIFPYLFKIDEIKDIGNKTIESKTSEIYSGYDIPTLKTYVTKKIHRKKIKINFEEKLDESKSSPEQIKSTFKKILELPETELFEFDFIIKGYYIYNTETETVEKIEVDKEIKFYNITTSTKRVLELEGFDENEKDEGRTYDEAVGELFEYLDKLGHKKEIDRQEFENFLDGIAFSEKPKIFKTLKWYIETNKIGFLELIEGERDRIYISEKEVLKVFEEIFDM